MGLAVAALAVLVAIALFFVLRDDDSGSGGAAPTSPAGQAQAQDDSARDGSEGSGNQPQADGTKPATIVVRDGQPVGGVQELAFQEGGQIRFIVESDVSDEVHLHGYDIAKEVEAGGVVRFDVPASIEGVFEVELEQRVVPLAEITVNP
jgi:hypothetical protein